MGCASSQDTDARCVDGTVANFDRLEPAAAAAAAVTQRTAADHRDVKHGAASAHQLDGADASDDDDDDDCADDDNSDGLLDLELTGSGEPCGDDGEGPTAGDARDDHHESQERALTEAEAEADAANSSVTPSPRSLRTTGRKVTFHGLPPLCPSSADGPRGRHGHGSSWSESALTPPHPGNLSCSSFGVAFSSPLSSQTAAHGGGQFPQAAPVSPCDASGSQPSLRLGSWRTGGRRSQPGTPQSASPSGSPLPFAARIQSFYSAEEIEAADPGFRLGVVAPATPVRL